MNNTNWLVNMRLEQGHTQESLAMKVKCSQSALANIESGKRKPSVKLAKKIAEALDFDWTKFFI